MTKTELSNEDKALQEQDGLLKQEEVEPLNKGPDGESLEEKPLTQEGDEEVLGGEGMGTPNANPKPETKAEEPKKEEPPKEQVSEKRGRRRESIKKQDVVPIDDLLSAQTDADKAAEDLLDLLEAERSRKPMTGIIQGFEKTKRDFSGSYVVVYHGACKILISSLKLIEIPENLSDKEREAYIAMAAQKRIGSEIDFIIKSVDDEEYTAVGNRLEAMQMKQREFYGDGDRALKKGDCAEARVMAVTRFGIYVEIFGVETFIPARELSYNRVFSPDQEFQTGQRVIVKILSIDKDKKGNIDVRASVKQAKENPYESELWKFKKDNLYLGQVSLITPRGVFVTLDGGVDCLCQLPRRGRPPLGSKVTVKINGINTVSNRVWGFITHMSVQR